jgi:hypothetical protein
MYQSTNVFVVLDPAPARMVEAQAGKRYYSEREPCLTALWSFHFISSQPHLISFPSSRWGSGAASPTWCCRASSSLLVTLRQLGEILGRFRFKLISNSSRKCRSPLPATGFGVGPAEKEEMSRDRGPEEAKRRPRLHQDFTKTPLVLHPDSLFSSCRCGGSSREGLWWPQRSSSQARENKRASTIHQP